LLCGRFFGEALIDGFEEALGRCRRQITHFRNGNTGNYAIAIYSICEANVFVIVPELVSLERPQACRPQIPFDEKVDHPFK
jgi:hypothetical protein